MYYTVDRFEEGYAVCECDDGTFVNIQKNKIPTSVKEGDILFEGEEGLIIDHAKTAARKEKMQKLLHTLWE